MSFVARSTGAVLVDVMETGWTQRRSKGWRIQTGENHHLAKVRVAGSNPVFRSSPERVQVAAV
jgi:hypothetical protein